MFRLQTFTSNESILHSSIPKDSRPRTSYVRSPLARIFWCLALLVSSGTQASADSIPRPGRQVDVWPNYDKDGTARIYGDPETSKYVLYQMERLSIGGPWRNDAPVVIPKTNYTGDYVIERTGTNPELKDNPPIYRITRPGESTNLLPANYSNEQPVRRAFTDEYTSSYAIETRSVTIEGVNSLGLALGSARSDWTNVPGTGPDGSWNPAPYPEAGQLPPGQYPESRFVIDLSTGKPVILDPLGYNWSSFTGYTKEDVPKMVDIKAMNDKGEILGVAQGALSLPLYYSTPTATPEILASLVSAAPGEDSEWALSSVSSIDDNGIIYGIANPAYGLDRRHWRWGGEPYHVALVPRGMAPPFDVAPAPVPEPSTWIIGVGMIAAAAWKQRRQGRS